MMDKLLVDTNIVIDLLSKREGFYESASRLFTLADTKKVTLAISSLTFANTYYLISKELNSITAKEVLRKFKLLVTVFPLDEKIIDLALNSDFKDFEDALQYYTALENKFGVIITRNIKDFKSAKIPVMNAGEYLSIK